MCSVSNPVQLIAIISLICASGIFVVVGGASIIALATTIVNIVIPMILAGATVSEIIGVITGSDVIIVSGSIEALANLITSIMSILSC